MILCKIQKKQKSVKSGKRRERAGPSKPEGKRRNALVLARQAKQSPNVENSNDYKAFYMLIVLKYPQTGGQREFKDEWCEKIGKKWGYKRGTNSKTAYLIEIDVS